MARHHDHLEPLADGFVAFHTEDGKRWKHRDVESSRTGPGYRLFVSDNGEERRYTFAPAEPPAPPVSDGREPLARATRALAPAPPGAAGADREAAPGGA